MSLTLNTLTYVFDTSRTSDWVRYLGPSNTAATKDYLDAKRVAPKATATYAGQSKASVKLTRTMTDGASVVVGDGLIELSVSFPAESDSTEQAAMITDLATWLLTTAADDLLSDHIINQ